MGNKQAAVAKEKGIAAKEKDIAGEKDIAAEEKDIAGEKKGIADEEKDGAAEEKDIAGEEKNIAVEERDIAAEEKGIAKEGKGIATEEEDIAAADSPAVQRLPVLEDDVESLEMIIHRRQEEIFRVCIITSCPDCMGPGHENHLGHKVQNWRDKNYFDSSEPENADVIVVEGRFPDEAKARAFTEIFDHMLQPRIFFYSEACTQALQLQRLVADEHRRTEDAHFYTYQQVGKSRPFSSQLE